MDPSAPPGTGPRPLARLERFAPPAILVVLPCVLVFSSVGAQEMLFGADMLQGSCYIRALVGRELSAGRAATWDPHAMCGFPLLAALQSGVFYPLTWPVLILGPGAFWTFTALAHVILAGLFTFAWLRRGLGLSPWAALVGGLVCMLSGYLLTHIHAGHISQISAHPWVAALLWRMERLLAGPTLRRASLLALVTALLILPGFPQSVFFGLLLMLVRLTLHVFQTREGRRERLKTSLVTLGAVAMGGLLAAPQLLPTMELIPRTQRVSINTYDFATTFSLPPRQLVTFLLPGFFGGGPGLPYWGQMVFWEICGFVGLGALALGALGLGGRHPQRYLWAGVAAAAVLLALGRYTPFFKVFYYGVPGADLFRAPGRYLALFTLAASALAAMGLDRWGKEEPGVERAARRTAIGTAALLATMLLFLGAVAASGGAESSLWKGILSAQESDPDSSLCKMQAAIPRFNAQAWRRAGENLAWAAVSLLIATAALAAYARRRIRARTGAAIVGTLAVLELLGFGSTVLTGFPQSNLGWPPAYVELLKKRPGGPYRVATAGMDHPDFVGKCQLAALDHVGGYESMLLRTYAELLNSVAGRPANMPSVGVPIFAPHPVFDMLGVRFWMLPPGARIPREWTRVATVEDSEVFESPGAFPRAFLVPKGVVLPDRDERLRFLTDPAVDFHQVVALEAALPQALVSQPGDLGTASVVSHGPGCYEISAETGSGAFLVLTESEYPGWEARVDGAPAEILRANHFVQAVWLAPGKHSVGFQYRSRWLALGFWIFLLAAAVPVGFAVGRRRLAPVSGSGR
jgi:hypothetical protein